MIIGEFDCPLINRNFNSLVLHDNGKIKRKIYNKKNSTEFVYYNDS